MGDLKDEARPRRNYCWSCDKSIPISQDWCDRCWIRVKLQTLKTRDAWSITTEEILRRIKELEALILEGGESE